MAFDDYFSPYVEQKILDAQLSFQGSVENMNSLMDEGGNQNPGYREAEYWARNYSSELNFWTTVRSLFNERQGG